jgi:hypothetical protein
MELTKDGLAALRVSALWAGDDDRVLNIRIRRGRPPHLLPFIDTFFYHATKAADERTDVQYPDSCGDCIVMVHRSSKRFILQNGVKPVSKVAKLSQRRFIYGPISLPRSINRPIGRRQEKHSSHQHRNRCTRCRQTRCGFRTEACRVRRSPR